MNARDPKEDRLTLELLSAIETHDDLSQRRLAREMGIALGLANSYLKRCVRRGFVKISEAPANRYLYYLTPKGFSEKSRLTARYLSNSLDFYRQAGSACETVFEQCVEQGIEQVALCGQSDLAEIAVLKSLESPVMVLGLYDPDWGQPTFYSRPVWKDRGEIPGEGEIGFVVTSVDNAVDFYDALLDFAGPEKVFVPRILGIDTRIKTTKGVS